MCHDGQGTLLGRESLGLRNDHFISGNYGIIKKKQLLGYYAKSVQYQGHTFRSRLTSVNPKQMEMLSEQPEFSAKVVKMAGVSGALL